MLGLAVVVAGAAHARELAAPPVLRLAGQQPLVVRGERFAPGERVVVTALTLIGPKRNVVRASPVGRFGVTFRLPAQPCGKAFAVRAVGGLGNRAIVWVPSRACVPPPID